MSRSYRIRTTPGDGNGYIKVNVDLNQNYDHLEILSLKISQKDEYQNFCADYGVIAGRVIINGGFGVPNVKVSIFVPVTENDLTDPVKSAIYPYTEPFPDQKNRNGVRYNLLPKNQQKLDHTPVGTFPKKREILDDGTTLEIYEKYYKYTTTTNESGDYILFGIPVGNHFLHYDMDVSDIGFLSVRPFEMMEQGYGENLFNNRFKFKGSNNLSELPQIFSENIPVTVEPYWCDSLSVGSALGINRVDIEPNVTITPTAIFMGSVFTDDEKDSLNKNCKPSREMGKLNEVITGAGKIEAIRRTVDGEIEIYEFKDNAIDDNGNWSVIVPMNIRKVVTDEFGNLIPSPDGIKGVATEGDYRFRISMDVTSNDKRLRQRAKYLVPNTNNNFNFGEYPLKELKNKDIFTKNEQLSTTTVGTPYENDITNQYNYLEEFFPFRWKKVYTVKQYIGRMQKVRNDESRGFIGIKDIVNAEGVNKFPSNRIDTNFNVLYTIICLLLSLFATIVGIINGLIIFLNGFISALCNIRFPISLCAASFKTANVDVRFHVERWCSDDGQYVDGGCGYGGNNAGEAKNVGTEAGTYIDLDGASSGGWDFGIGISCDEVTGSGVDDGNMNGANGWRYISALPLIVPYQTIGGITYYRFSDQTPYPPEVVACEINNIPTSLPDWALGRYPNEDLGSDFDLDGLDKSSFVCPGGVGPIGNSRWCYSNISCISSPNNQCRRWRFKDGNNEPAYIQNAINNCGKNTNDCLKQECKDDPDALAILGACWRLKYKCLFGGILCRKCKDICGYEEHSCCADPTYGCPNNDASCIPGQGGCCTTCCAKIPLIPLKCADEGKEYRLSLLGSPFGAELGCNATFVPFNGCISCGGTQTPGIKDWVSCVMEPIAVSLRMLKFDFYNDWVGGVLYFPLIKRKYKLKKRKRKFGQIKKDKFCDFECRERGDDENFQGNPTYNQWRIKIPTIVFSNPTIEVNGCIAKVKGKRVTNWYGTEENDDQTFNLDLAVKELEFRGNNSDDEGCIISFDTFTQFSNTFSNINYSIKDREIQSTHGKPEYVETEDANGFSTWENIGGHGHHRNICDNTRMVERKEYFKSTLDCNAIAVFPATEPDILGEIVQPEPETDEPINLTCGDDLSCNPDCGTNGVKPCIYPFLEFGEYSSIVKHGLISWNNGEIYYTPYIPSDDVKYNQSEYKANLMLPTTIMELGSSVFCDIDDVPFIMNQVPPTTFNVSYEDLKYRFKNGVNTNYIGSEGPGILKEIKKYEDKKDISLNLRAYVEFSCFSTVCSNIAATVNQSQIGVEIIDKNDIGIEIGSCFLRFDHDDDIRQYFCRRFNGYKGNDLSFHHQRPGSIEWENEYNTYPEITLSDGTNLYYQLPEEDDEEIIFSEYNDSDSFIPGDGCGYRNSSQNGGTDYFYGLAPGQTSGFIDYPNVSPQTINFGQTAQQNDIDNIFISGTLTEDLNNGSEDIKGIKFNRTQTPYYLYFGLVPGKTALHKTVSYFFADRINEVTLLGLGEDTNTPEENINNSPNVNGGQTNNFSVYKTCLGETLVEKVTPQ